MVHYSASERNPGNPTTSTDVNQSESTFQIASISNTQPFESIILKFCLMDSQLCMALLDLLVNSRIAIDRNNASLGVVLTRWLQQWVTIVTWLLRDHAYRSWKTRIFAFVYIESFTWQSRVHLYVFSWTVCILVWYAVGYPFFIGLCEFTRVPGDCNCRSCFLPFRDATCAA